MANDNDLDDIPSLVPERDELVSHRKRKRGNSTTSTVSAPYAADVAASGGSGSNGFVVFMLTVLFLGLCGSVAGGYYFYMEGQTAKEGMERALTRIGQLETRLNLVDEASVQSSTGLLERVDFNFTEIDKLWAARNQMRTEVGELKTSMTAVQELAKGMETAVGNQATMINDSRNALNTLQARVEQMNKNFSGMDNLGEQLTLLNADLNRVKTAMEKVQTDVETRLRSTEQDIESINVYRLQVNQNLAAMQESVNRLQQRVGQ